MNADQEETLVRVTINPGICVGAGQCVLAAEEVFDQDDDGIVLLLDADPASPQQIGARRAASLCPARAITITDDE